MPEHDFFSALIWQRDALAHGQWWRLLTAHLVHLNLRHLLLNLLGLVLILELLRDEISIADTLSLACVSALGVGLLLWLLQPQLQWYAGLSGVLYGLWAGCAGAGWLRRKNLYFSSAIILLIARLFCISSGATDIPVVSAAHLYGALSGMIWLAVHRLQQRNRVLH